LNLQPINLLFKVFNLFVNKSIHIGIGCILQLFQFALLVIQFLFHLSKSFFMLQVFLLGSLRFMFELINLLLPFFELIPQSLQSPVHMVQLARFRCHFILSIS
jgi:hypothetical protein